MQGSTHDDGHQQSNLDTQHNTHNGSSLASNIKDKKKIENKMDKLTSSQQFS